MTYSCSDLADDVTNQLAVAGLLGDSIPDDDPEECGRLIGLSIGKLIADKATMMVALKRTAPWLGRAIVEGIHKTCAMPNDLPRTLEMVEAATAGDDAPPIVTLSERDNTIVGLAVEQVKWKDGALEMGATTDTSAMVSEGEDNGAYVRAWVWVDFAGTPLDKSDDEARAEAYSESKEC